MRNLRVLHSIVLLLLWMAWTAATPAPARAREHPLPSQSDEWLSGADHDHSACRTFHAVPLVARSCGSPFAGRPPPKRSHWTTPVIPFSAQRLPVPAKARGLESSNSAILLPLRIASLEIAPNAPPSL